MMEMMKMVKIMKKMKNILVPVVHDDRFFCSEAPVNGKDVDDTLMLWQGRVSQ